jgi:SAM-dependent methyltransferase
MAFQSEVAIDLVLPVELPEDYVARHRFLSSARRDLRVTFRGDELFVTAVPAGAFNPYKGVAAHKLMEMVLTGALGVRGRRVVDLGCGSGVVGLACLRAGAASVLFTDINPAVVALREQPLLRPQDRVKVQDLLEDEPAASCDVVLMSTPTNRVDGATPVAPDTVDSAIFRTDDFLPRLLSEAARCLVPGGVLGLWIKVSHEGVLPYHAFLLALHEGFDLGSMQIYWHAQESEVRVGRQDHSGENSHLVFWIHKRSPALGVGEER